MIYFQSNLFEQINYFNQRMPKKPFTGKAKKKQLQAKREEKRDRQDVPFGERRKFVSMSVC